MNRLIIFVSVLIVALTSIAQDDNNKNVLIRHDRVWVSRGFQGDKKENTVRYMMFKDSKDFMDKTYTRVSTIKKVRWTDDDATDIRIEEDIDETEAWMREEDGKVYLLLDGWQSYDDSSSTDLSEGLLYDFNAERGSSYDCISLFKPYEDTPGNYLAGHNSVLSDWTENVGDQEVKSWDFIFIPPGVEVLPTMCYEMVEGIGIVDYGCLFYIETHSRHAQNYCYHFLCCTDMDGNVIYPVDSNIELPGGGLPANVNNVIDSDSGDMTNVSGAIYDILGRRILAPAPGQLYIQDGKKHIAK